VTNEVGTEETAIDVVATGLRFPEGPVALADGSVLLVEIERQTLSRVQPDGSVSVVAELGGGPNGAAIGPDGRCWVCNNGGMSFHERNGRLYPSGQADDYSGGRIEAVDLDTGEVETVYASSSELVGVFYAKADGSHIEEVIFPLEGPNGIGLSPDEDEVYVAETTTGRVWAYELSGPGTLLGERRDKPDGGRLLPGREGFLMYDSLAMDSAGNVCVATIVDGGITIVSPRGEPARFVPMPDRITTNICFGGDDLATAYVTLSSTGQLVTLPWERPGLALNHLNT